MMHHPINTFIQGLSMLAPVDVHKALQSAGFSVPATHPMIAADGSRKDPATEGFEVVDMGGHCDAFRRDYGRFYMILSSCSGEDLPRPKSWGKSLIGVYVQEDDVMLASVTAEEWQRVINAAAASS